MTILVQLLYKQRTIVKHFEDTLGVPIIENKV